jgi:predicted O-linked N-acetylglucosamine transferase (SPINDLY family)
MSHVTRHITLLNPGAADLFLDNLWVNAHTTATETLWAGVPVLTAPHVPLASRVASSLLHAAHLPELITRNADDYFHLARTLSSRPHLIRALQRKLRAARSSLPLFHSRAYADEFERVLFLFVEAQAAAGGGGGRGRSMHVAATDAAARAGGVGARSE